MVERMVAARSQHRLEKPLTDEQKMFYFGGSLDKKDMAREISRMGQRELQVSAKHIQLLKLIFVASTIDNICLYSTSSWRCTSATPSPTITCG